MCYCDRGEEGYLKSEGTETLDMDGNGSQRTWGTEVAGRCLRLGVYAFCVS